MTKELSQLPGLTELETFNPITLKEYCYRDGCPTDWTRKPLTPKQVEDRRIPYYCRSCDDRGYFVLQTRGKRE